MQVLIGVPVLVLVPVVKLPAGRVQYSASTGTGTAQSALRLPVVVYYTTGAVLVLALVQY
jgi:hypothetical protein